MKPSLLRIMDANYNRTKEALRVVEDFARFFLNDARLSAAFKRARHDLTRALLRFPVSYRKLVAARDSANDIGRDRWIQDGQRRRPGWKEVMIANQKRAQEGLRVMEEVSKIIAPAQSPAFQRLRFKLYELEKDSFRKF